MSRLDINFAERFPPLTEAEELAVQDRLRREENRQLEARAAKAEAALRGDLGRYKGWNLSEYEIYAGEPQRSARDRTQNMGNRIDKLIRERHNVIWWGSIGTGKDQLATWVLRVAASKGHSVRWLPAREFYSQMASAFGDGLSQREVVNEWLRPTVLCLSDPVYLIGWNAKHGEYLNALIRARYDSGKATWVTCNVASLDDKDDEESGHNLFGPDVWDRLRENSVCIPCRWRSHRKLQAERNEAKR